MLAPPRFHTACLFPAFDGILTKIGKSWIHHAHDDAVGSQFGTRGASAAASASSVAARS